MRISKCSLNIGNIRLFLSCNYLMLLFPVSRRHFNHINQSPTTRLLVSINKGAWEIHEKKQSSSSSIISQRTLLNSKQKTVRWRCFHNIPITTVESAQDWVGNRNPISFEMPSSWSSNSGGAQSSATHPYKMQDGAYKKLENNMK